MDWRAWFGFDMAKNPYLRLREADRLADGKKMLVLMLGAMLLFWILTVLHWDL